MDQYASQYQYGQYGELLPETGGISPLFLLLVIGAIALIVAGFIIKGLIQR